MLTTPAERHTLVNLTNDRCLLHVDTHTGQPLCDAEPLATFATPVNFLMQRRLLDDTASATLQLRKLLMF